MDWRRLFPDNDFKFPMALRPGDAKAFFAAKESFPKLTIFEERCRWIEDWNAVDHYVAAEPDALNIVSQFVQTFHVEGDILLPSNCANALSRAAGMALEPDWVLLRPDAQGVYRMVAGAVCFSSGWAMREKMGKPIDEIHAIVPGLNDALGRQINSFLSKLAPETSWERENWGLSADSEMNHHPSCHLKKLDSNATIETTWIRLERQVFYKLPRTNAIVFGIRVSNHFISEISKEPEASRRFARALQTMPEPVAVYKGIAAAREPLIEQLKAVAR